MMGGGSGGDPHVQTFDGLAYDFHGAGEYVLSSDTSSVVQVRQTPIRGGPLSVQTAVAVAFGAARVGIYVRCADGFGRSSAMEGEEVGLAAPEMLVVNDAGTASPVCDHEVLLDGAAIHLQQGEPMPLPAGSMLKRSSGLYQITLGDEQPAASVVVGVGSYYLNVRINQTRLNGHAVGLLGDGDGNPYNDIRPRDSAPLDPVTKRDLYGVFGESWRVTDAESLFEYLPGESTATFTDRSFPPDQIGLARPNTKRRDTAKELCRRAGVVDPYWLDACAIDVASTGNSEFAQSTAQLQIPVVAALELVDEPREAGGRARSATAVGSVNGMDAGAGDVTRLRQRPPGCSVTQAGAKSDALALMLAAALVTGWRTRPRRGRTNSGQMRRF